MLACMLCALVYTLILASPAKCSFPALYPVLGNGGGASSSQLGALFRITPILFLALTSIVLSDGPPRAKS